MRIDRKRMFVWSQRYFQWQVTKKRTKPIWIMYFLEIEFLWTPTVTCQNEQPACENEKKRIVHSKCMSGKGIFSIDIRFTEENWRRGLKNSALLGHHRFDYCWKVENRSALYWIFMRFCFRLLFLFVFFRIFSCFCRIVIAYWNRKWNTNTFTWWAFNVWNCIKDFL